MKRWWRGTFGLVALVALGFALATLAIGVVAFETTHEALEQQLDHRIAAETKALIDEGDDGPTGIAMAIAIFENSTANAIFAAMTMAPANNYAADISAVVEFTPGSIAAQTIAVRAGPSSNTMRFNGTAAARFFGGKSQATLLVEEIATAVP